MGTFYEHDDELPLGDCGCGQCAGQDDFWPDDEEDIYDDPFEVVMYDIDAEPDDLYALIDMLNDGVRSWYAKRRLNALAAAGPLSSLMAAIIIDSLGRHWNPLLHPRDRFGQFIETGGFIRWLMNAIKPVGCRTNSIDLLVFGENLLNDLAHHRGVINHEGLHEGGAASFSGCIHLSTIPPSSFPDSPRSLV